MAAGGPFHLLGLDAEWWVSPVSKDWPPAARATQEKMGHQPWPWLTPNVQVGRARPPLAWVVLLVVG